LRDDWLLAAVAIAHALQHHVDAAADAKGVARSGPRIGHGGGTEREPKSQLMEVVLMPPQPALDA
jgi:hypothetical protein